MSSQATSKVPPMEALERGSKPLSDVPKALINLGSREVLFGAPSGGPGGLPLSACGSGDGAIAGMDVRAPVGSEAVCHLTENHGRADFVLTGVVNRHAASGASRFWQSDRGRGIDGPPG